MGVIPLHEAIIKGVSKPTALNNAGNVAAARSASLPSNPITSASTGGFTPSLSCSERRVSLSHTISSTRTSVSGLTQSSVSATQLNTSSSKAQSPMVAATAGSISKTTIRRNCAYASVSRIFPYYVPVPSSAKLNGKPKKYQSFVQTTIEQEQSVLSPSGSEGSSRDSGFNSDASSPIPPIVSSDIDQLLDEIASLDDIN